jgi:formylglycine-generating enzyme required for sulfatase activity
VNAGDRAVNLAPTTLAKKGITQLLGLFVIAFMAVAFTACGEEPKKPPTKGDNDQKISRPSTPVPDPITRTFDLGEGVNLEMVLISAGTFKMGSLDSEVGSQSDETRHEVTISKPFYLGKYPITVAQWKRFVAVTDYKTEAETSGGAFKWDGKEWKLDPDTNWKHPGFRQAPTHPVVCVSWNDVQKFHSWLNALALKNATTFAMPSESQWEYACRAGTTTPFHFGSELNGTQANCDGNFPYGTNRKGPFVEKTTPVGTYPPNAWGLYDMHGNVWQWCSDWYGEYPEKPIKDPVGPLSGKHRVLRGGSWFINANLCRAASRLRTFPSNRDDDCGGRVFLALDF